MPHDQTEPVFDQGNPMLAEIADRFRQILRLPSDPQDDLKITPFNRDSGRSPIPQGFEAIALIAPRGKKIDSPRTHPAQTEPLDVPEPPSALADKSIDPAVAARLFNMLLNPLEADDARKTVSNRIKADDGYLVTLNQHLLSDLQQVARAATEREETSGHALHDAAVFASRLQRVLRGRGSGIKMDFLLEDYVGNGAPPVAIAHYPNPTPLEIARKNSMAQALRDNGILSYETPGINALFVQIPPTEKQNDVLKAIDQALHVTRSVLPDRTDEPSASPPPPQPVVNKPSLAQRVKGWFKGRGGEGNPNPPSE